MALGQIVSHLILAAPAPQRSLNCADERLRSHRPLQQNQVSERLSSEYSPLTLLINFPCQGEENQRKIRPRGLVGNLRCPLGDVGQVEALLRQNYGARPFFQLDLS